VLFQWDSENIFVSVFCFHECQDSEKPNPGFEDSESTLGVFPVFFDLTRRNTILEKSEDSEKPNPGFAKES
jgi:hypothetical protein